MGINFCLCAAIFAFVAAYDYCVLIAWVENIICEPTIKITKQKTKLYLKNHNIAFVV